MILQNEFWLMMVPDREFDRSAIKGKWVFLDERSRLHGLVGTLDSWVESGRVRAAKLARKLPSSDPFPDRPCALYVFTSDDQQELDRVRALVESGLGLKAVNWKSEQETARDWRDGGPLRTQAELTRISRQLESGALQFDERVKSRIASLLKQMDVALDAADRSGRLDKRQELLVDQIRRTVDEPASSENLDLIVRKLQELEYEGLQAPRRGEPTGASPSRSDAQASVFVIMPFAPSHVDTFDTIDRAVKRVRSGVRVVRIDEQPGSFSIVDEVVREIDRAGLVICDLTDERPNVYFELGYARGRGKLVLCIAKSGTNIHFDVSGYRTLMYDTYRQLEDRLQSEIDALLR